MLRRWRRSARAEDEDLAAKQRALDERLERAKRAAEERKAKQAADEAEVVRSATIEGRETAEELARKAAADARARQTAQRKAWLAAADLARHGVKAGAADPETARQAAEVAAARQAAEVEAARVAEGLANQTKAAEESARAERTGTLPILDWFAARDQSLSRAEADQEGVANTREPPG